MAGDALRQIREWLDAAGPPELGPGPRGGVPAKEELNRKLDAVFSNSQVAIGKQELVRALVLLWHDHLEAAHVIAQEIESADGAFVHGIVHRREPDYGNAAYWFRRVGWHPAFPEIARRVTGLLEARGDRGLLEELTPQGQWDAFGFIEACRRAARRDDQETLKLQAVQQAEMETLLEWLWEGR